MSHVSKAARDLAKARERAASAETALQNQIRAALAAGWSAATVAAEAGITRQRVYQIRDGKR